MSESVRYKNGIYTGDRVDNKRQGYGSFAFDNGGVHCVLCVNAELLVDRYDGEWNGDKMSGYGTYFYSNGEKYIGTWMNSQKHGTGVYHYSDGSR